MAVEMNQKYENRKADKDGNHKVASVVRIDEKAKTCILQSDDGKAYGPMTFSTLTKSWKKLEDEVVEEVKEEVAEPEVVEEEKLADGTTYKQAMADILHDEKIAIEKAKKAKKEKKEKAPKAEKPKKEKKPAAPKLDDGVKMAMVNDIAGIIEKNGSTAKIFEKKCMVALFNKKKVLECHVRNDKIVVWARVSLFDVVDNSKMENVKKSTGVKGWGNFSVADVATLKDILDDLR